MWEQELLPVETGPVVVLEFPIAPLVAAIHQRGVVLQDQPERLQRAFYRAQEAGVASWELVDEVCVSLLLEHPFTVVGESWWIPTG